LLARSDIVVCPYVTDRFRAAYSALAAEAIAAGIPLVAPAHTTLARTMQDFAHGGTCFDANTADSIVAAIGHVLDGFDVHAEAAEAAAARWSETMGADKMVTAMLARVAAGIMDRRAPFRIAA